MTAPFAQRCGVDDSARAAARTRLLDRARELGLQRVRIGWCDLHGVLRGKTIVVDPEGRDAGTAALADAVDDGVGLVSTMLLKDTADRTVFKVFERGVEAELPDFGFANNVVLLPEPASLRVLPWAPATGWLRAQAWHADGRPVELDTRRVLQRAVAALAEHGGAGWRLRCGLEVEFHVWRLHDEPLDPHQAAWPGPAPTVSLLHPGYQLLSEGYADATDEVLDIVRHTALGLGLPLRSLEIELGPSQFEAVFGVMDALDAADAMVVFRNGVRQALRRAGYHASFVCRPPFANVMASGWHLHQSLVDVAGEPVFVRDEAAAGSDRGDARHALSDAGAHWLAGLLAHAAGTAALCVPTINGFGRFRPNALAPNAVVWGRDNRGAMLRLIGGAGERGTHLENRLGEPAANPYLYLAAQVFAGLDGLQRRLEPPRATDAPYAAGAPTLPVSLGEALDALLADPAVTGGIDPGFLRMFVAAKRQEIARHDAAEDRAEWERREYFARL